MALPFPRGVRHDDLPAVPVQPAGARVERFCIAELPFSPVPGGTQPAVECAAGPQSAPAAPARRRCLRASNIMKRACAVTIFAQGAKQGPLLSLLRALGRFGSNAHVFHYVRRSEEMV